MDVVREEERERGITEGKTPDDGAAGDGDPWQSSSVGEGGGGGWRWWRRCRCSRPASSVASEKENPRSAARPPFLSCRPSLYALQFFPPTCSVFYCPRHTFLIYIFKNIMAKNLFYVAIILLEFKNILTFGF